jgi:hypothetical protein
MHFDNLSKLKDDITGFSGTKSKEDSSFNVETERAELITISNLFYKVPVGPLTTLNFTASPYDQISNAKRTKDKDKKKSKFAKVRKQKRMRFCEIPKNRGQSALMSFTGTEVLAAHVAQQYGGELRIKYGLNPNLSCTERILEYDDSINPFVYLDHLRELEEDFIRAEPLLLKWETAVLAKKKKYEKETGKQFDFAPRRPEIAKKENSKPMTENEIKNMQNKELMSKLPVNERAGLIVVDCTETGTLRHIKWPWDPLVDESDSSAEGDESSKKQPIAQATQEPITEDKPEPIFPLKHIIEPEVYYKKPRFSFTCEASTQVDITVRVEEIANKGESRWREVLEYYRQCESIKTGELEKRQKGLQHLEVKFRPKGVRNYYYITDPTRPKKIVVGAHYEDRFMVNGTINYDSDNQVVGEWRDPRLFQTSHSYRDNVAFY